MHVLVTGGAGYIGSHTCLALLEAGNQVTAVDNLSNASEESLRRVVQLAGKTLELIKADLRDPEVVDQIFAEQQFDNVIHFAALKAVGESVSRPLDYYENNVGATLNLCRAMQRADVTDLVFSSSATVYGRPRQLPLAESAPTLMEELTNPYGRTKLMVEWILRDWHKAWPASNLALLRYFNPVGAHPSGQIGEDPSGIPNNLLPYVSQVAVGKRDKLSIFGGDYETRDGTGVRDYIHVVDLADGHVLALEHLESNPGVVTFNLGTGNGYSVLEIVAAFEKASGKPVPYEIVDRRPGDVAACYADPSLAAETLGWTARHNLETMCRDSWRWQSNNPDGYGARPSASD